MSNSKSEQGLNDSQSELRKVATDAEHNLNSSKAKSGGGKPTSDDDGGVDTSVDQKFPGSKVQVGDEVNSSASYNKRIPPEEGGELDDRGRASRGEMFEGEGGPEDKIPRGGQDGAGDNDNDVV